MPSVPINITAFADLLDPRFSEIWDGAFDQPDNMIEKLHTIKEATQYVERGSAITGMGLFGEHQGTVTYDGPDQGFDWSTTFKEYSKGMQVERPIIEFDQFGVAEDLFQLLAESANDSLELEAANTFINAFIVDSGYTHTEGVALCSDSHISPRSGVSTTTGFDNLSTAAFSPLALKTDFINMRKFKKDNGQPIGNHGATAIIGPVDLQDRAEEVFGTMKGLDSAEHTKNVLENRYRYIPWIRLTNTTNFYVVNEAAMKKNLYWYYKVRPEYSRMEDFDKIIAKWRGYYFIARARKDWRWLIGHNVS